MDDLPNLGIRIQDLNLSKVSGPIAISLMVPKENIIAPVVLILGEQHIEVNHGCPDINANDQINHLFEKINTISAVDNFDINFYAEIFLNKTISNKIKNSQDETYINNKFDKEYDETTFKPPGLLNMVSTPYKACYYNEIKKKYPEVFIQKCKYPNIKWQYNDIRTNLYNNKITIINLDLLDKAVCNLIVYLSPLSRLYNEQFPNEYNNRISYFDKTIKMMEKMKKDPSFEKGLKTYKKNKEEFMNPNLNIIIKNLLVVLGLNEGKIKDQMITLEEEEYRSQKIPFVDFVNALKLVPLFYFKDFDTIIDKLLETDIFKKQIKQQNIDNIKLNFKKYLIYWYDRTYTNPVCKRVNDYVINLLILIVDFLENINDDDITMNDNDVIYSENIHQKFTPIIDYINTHNIDDYINNNNEKKIMYGGIPPPGDYYVHKNYEQICELITLESFIKPFSIVVDMYFILRIFKYEITKPTLVCSLIGSAHKTNIAEYFKITGNYHVFNFKRMSATKNTPLYQCVDTINNVTEITNNDKIINNFSIDIYDLLKRQESLIFQKINPSEESNIHILEDGSFPTEGGYKKRRKYKTKRRKYKTKRRKYKTKRRKY